jgi:molybdopterin molybdotransferase
MDDDKSVEMLSYGQAAEMIAQAALRLVEGRRCATWSEWVALKDARGRVLAQRILADRDQPAFARSTRDGFAVRVSDLKVGGEQTRLPVAGMTRAGEPAAELPPDAAWEILTGAPIPRGADAVLMQEHAEVSEGWLRFCRDLKAGENLVRQGTEAKSGDVLLEPGRVMGAAEIGLAASCGYTKMRAQTRARVLILTTGDELVEPENFPKAGEIRNANGALLSAMVDEAGAIAIQLPTARDQAEALDEALDEALKRAAQMQTEAPVLLVMAGGVSVGRFDLVEAALAKRGARFHFTGVTMQPGKPMVFGELGEPLGLKFFGLPGNPISAAVTFRLFVEPIIAALMGSSMVLPQFSTARLEGAWRGMSGLTRFLPGVCEAGEFGAIGAPVVRLVHWQGSGDLKAFAQSNCLLVIPAEISDLAAGVEVQIVAR